MSPSRCNAPKPNAAKQPTPVYGLDGTFLGMFEPTEDTDPDPELSHQELMRRLADSGGRGRKIAEILRDLEACGRRGG